MRGDAMSLCDEEVLTVLGPDAATGLEHAARPGDGATAREFADKRVCFVTRRRGARTAVVVASALDRASGDDAGR